MEKCAGNAISTLITEVEIASGSPGTYRRRREKEEVCASEGERERSAKRGRESSHRRGKARKIERCWGIIFWGVKGSGTERKSLCGSPLQCCECFLIGGREVKKLMLTSAPTYIIHPGPLRRVQPATGFPCPHTHTRTHHKPTAALLPTFILSACGMSQPHSLSETKQQLC